MLINELPKNEDAERNLVGLTLLKKRVPQGAKVLATTDFYAPVYREMWSAFLELEEDGREIDPLSAHEIAKRNKPGIENTFPISSLLDTLHGMPNSHENVFVDKIRSAAVRRFLIRELSASIQSLTNGEKGAIQNLRRKINDLEYAEESKGSFISLKDIIRREVKPALLDLHHGITHKIATGFEALDRVIGGGISLSDVMLVAGVPGGGKSAFVLQMASNIAKQGVPVAFLSGEMSHKENGLRLLSQMSKSHNLNSAMHLTAQELDFFNQWCDAIEDLPIDFDCRTYDLRTLSRSMRTMVEEKGVKVLVIDYIQIMKLDKLSKHQRTERITETSQEVKRIAMEYGIAVIEVAQFNREGAKSLKPTMQDLEGSSQLEKDTSLIFLLDRAPDSPEVTLRIVKGRNSGTSEVVGRFDGWRLGFDF